MIIIKSQELNKLPVLQGMFRQGTQTSSYFLYRLKLTINKVQNNLNCALQSDRIQVRLYLIFLFL